MGLERFTVTRPLRCRKMIYKWDTIHAVWIKFLLLHLVGRQSWTKFCRLWIF